MIDVLTRALLLLVDGLLLPFDELIFYEPFVAGGGRPAALPSCMPGMLRRNSNDRRRSREGPMMLGRHAAMQPESLVARRSAMVDSFMQCFAGANGSCARSGGITPPSP